MKEWKVGDQVIVRFKRWSGTMHIRRGVIVKLHPKTGAATVYEAEGPIRVGFDELRKFQPRKKE